MHSTAIMRNRGWIEMRVVEGPAVDSLDLLRDWQAELRGHWVSGLSWLLASDVTLTSTPPDPGLRLVLPQPGCEVTTPCRGRPRGVFVSRLHVTDCRQSSRTCWQVLSVCLCLLQLAGRFLVGSSISPLSYTEGHHIRLACVLVACRCTE